MKTIVQNQLQILLDINHSNTKDPNRYDDRAFAGLEGKGLVQVNKKDNVCFLSPKGTLLLDTMSNLLELTED